MKTYKNIFSKPANRYQLVVRNANNLEERVIFRFTNTKLFVLSLLFFLGMLAFSLKMSSTILSKWLNAAHIEQANKEKIKELSICLEDLEVKNNQQERFISLLQSIILGKDMPSNSNLASDISKSVAKEDIVPYVPKENPAKNVPDEDVLLEEEPVVESNENQTDTADLCIDLEADQMTQIETSNSQAKKPLKEESSSNLKECFFFVPVEGDILTHYNSHTENYGVSIATKANTPIHCIADGMIVFSSWTAEYGWVVMVQHNKSLISIYKYSATPLKKIGALVKSGDVLAITTDSADPSIKSIVSFELWNEGNAINPEEFIAF